MVEVYEIARAGDPNFLLPGEKLKCVLSQLRGFIMIERLYIKRMRLLLISALLIFLSSPAAFAKTPETKSRGVVSTIVSCAANTCCYAVLDWCYNNVDVTIEAACHTYCKSRFPRSGFTHRFKYIGCKNLCIGRLNKATGDVCSNLNKFIKKSCLGLPELEAKPESKE